MGHNSGSVRAELNAREGVVTSVAFTPDGQRLLSTSANGVTRIWNAASGEVLLRWSETNPGLHHVAYRPDGKQVALARLDAVTRLLDAEELAPKSAAQLLEVAESKVHRALSAADCALYAEVLSVEEADPQL